MKPFEAQSYYELLEIKVSAPADEIRAAYQRLSEQYAEDQVALYGLVEPGSASALRARLLEAMEILTDDDLRVEYDRELGLPPRALARRPDDDDEPPAQLAMTDLLQLADRAVHSTHPRVPFEYVGEVKATSVQLAPRELAAVPLPPSSSPTPAPAAGGPPARPSAPAAEAAALEGEPVTTELAPRPSAGALGASGQSPAAEPAAGPDDASAVGATAPAETTQTFIGALPGETLPGTPPPEAAADDAGTTPPSAPAAENVNAQPFAAVRRSAASAEASPPGPEAEGSTGESPAQAESAPDRSAPRPLPPLPDESPALPRPLPSTASVLAQEAAIGVAESQLARVSKVAQANREARVTEPEPRPRLPELAPDAEYNGELLRTVRQAAGLSLQQLADKTRIGARHLESVEADRYSALPATVYLRGILMNLSRELGLDGLKVSKSYLGLVERAKSKG